MIFGYICNYISTYNIEIHFYRVYLNYMTVISILYYIVYLVNQYDLTIGLHSNSSVFLICRCYVYIYYTYIYYSMISHYHYIL